MNLISKSLDILCFILNTYGSDEVQKDSLCREHMSKHSIELMTSTMGFYKVLMFIYHMYGYFGYVYLCTPTSVPIMWRVRDEIRYPELKLHMGLSHLVSSGNQTLVLCKVNMLLSHLTIATNAGFMVPIMKSLNIYLIIP